MAGRKAAGAVGRRSCRLSLALVAAGTALARPLGLGWTAGASEHTGPARLALSESEQAFWLSRASNGWALSLALGGVGVGLVLGIVSRWEPAVVVVASSLAVLALSSVDVRASADGVVVRYGPLHWPYTRIALRRIVNAEAVDLAPKSWGYRGSLWLVGTAAVIVKRGAALSLSLVGGKSFLVTVDDAAGAALLNEELARVSHEGDQPYLDPRIVRSGLGHAFGVGDQQVAQDNRPVTSLSGPGHRRRTSSVASLPTGPFVSRITANTSAGGPRQGSPTPSPPARRTSYLK